MRKIFVLLVVSVFMMSGYSGAEEKKITIYTFTKERVDQDLKGNRGYVFGKVPKTEQAEKRKAMRTLIGIDIDLTELGSFLEKKEYVEKEEDQVTASVQVSGKSMDKPEKDKIQKNIKTSKPVLSEKKAVLENVSSSDSTAKKVVVVSEESVQKQDNIDSLDEDLSGEDMFEVEEAEWIK
ncbi:MAG: hypothetical protein ABH869_07020 [Candidatus Omnitrophota bacterium]